MRTRGSATLVLVVEKKAVGSVNMTNRTDTIFVSILLLFNSHFSCISQLSKQIFTITKTVNNQPTIEKH